MVVLIVVLYVAGALLPIAGFGRLLYRTQRRVREANEMVTERGYTHVSMADLGKEWGGDVREPLWAERRALIWDISFVGAGLITGAVASIWSLFLPA